MFSVDVSPDMGMYHLLRSQGYETAYALAEFIDNAVQAHMNRADAGKSNQLEVNLHFYSNDFTKPSKRNSIIISDNGPGIIKSRIADAMKPAKPSPVKGLSEFGIGMKAAAVWFSDEWKLSTKPSGGKSKYALTFDLPKLLGAASDTVEVTESKEAAVTGTTITLCQLRRPVDQAKFQQICSDLRELYQRYTAGSGARMKLIAHYNDTPEQLDFDSAGKAVLVAAVYRQVDKTLYAVGKPQTWQVSVDMTFQGVRIQGFVCLLERGSYVDNPGLVMFRGDRVIRGTARRPNLPTALFRTANKYSRQRVYGHLFSDGLPVTYTKDGFEIDEDAFAAQLRLVEGMDELLRQAEEYRANKEAIDVKKASDIPGTKAGRKKASASETKVGEKSKTAAPAPSPAAKKTTTSAQPLPPLLKLLTDLKEKAASLALRAIIEETIYQHQFRREIGTALCLRVVVELAVVDHIRRTLPAQYVKVSEKLIKGLLNYMNSNPGDFFDLKADHHVVKCVQSLATGTQPDVVLLNNVAHAHYQPNFGELNRFATNLEPLLRWAVA